MAPAAICQWDTVSSLLHRRNSVFKADTSETQTVVKQAPLLIVTNPSLDAVSTLKKNASLKCPPGWDDVTVPCLRRSE